MEATWEINASPLLVQLRPRNVRLAAELGPHVAPALPDREKAAKAREEEAYARGRMDGERAVNEQLLRQRQEVRELQEKVLDPLRRAVSDVIRDTEQSLVALAIEVAERLVSGIPITAEMVQASINEALAQVKDKSECHIYLHPDDLQLLQSWSSADQSRTGILPVCTSDSSTALHFHADPAIQRGGCIVKTRFGTIDGRGSTKLEQLKRTLLS